MVSSLLLFLFLGHPTEYVVPGPAIRSQRSQDTTTESAVPQGNSHYCFFFPFVFLGLHSRYMEVPRLGVKLGL